MATQLDITCKSEDGPNSEIILTDQVSWSDIGIHPGHALAAPRTEAGHWTMTAAQSADCAGTNVVAFSSARLVRCTFR